MGQREETTEELSERVLARLRREYSLVSSARPISPRRSMRPDSSPRTRRSSARTPAGAFRRNSTSASARGAAGLHPFSELLFRMVNHSANSYRTSRGVFSDGYCPWCSPYHPKPLNDIDAVCGDMGLIEGIELALEVNDPHGAHLSMSHDNGIDCAYIPISYCPVCGRRLGAERKL